MPKRIVKVIEEVPDIPVVDEVPPVPDLPIDEVKSIEKSKRERTPAQVAAFEKALLKRNENRKARAVAREGEAETLREVKEAKIVKTAIKIQKKRIKEDIILDVPDVSSDDESIDSFHKKVIEVKKKVVAKKEKKVITPPAPVQRVKTLSAPVRALVSSEPTVTYVFK
jgi:hypothetical protein